MKKNDVDEMKDMIRDISRVFDLNHNATADCIEVIAKAVKHLGRRLEMLEEHVYNDRDDNYLN